MPSALSAWLQNAQAQASLPAGAHAGVRALRALAERPLLLWLFLLVLNALAQPYGGMTHDARLYAMQVQNRSQHNAYQDDLFFLHGSQDQFSLFSPALAPLASWLGIHWAFFLVYLLGNSLLLFALLRFVRALVPDPLTSTLALFYLVTVPIPYGRIDSFCVLEPYLTPRLLADALILLGLEQLLRGRYLAALPLLLAGCLLHPLMAIGAVLVLATCAVLRFLGPRGFLWLAIPTGMAVATVLACPQLGYRLLGRIDGAWGETVYSLSPYLYLQQWTAEDWVDSVLALLIVSAAAVLLSRREDSQGRFLGALALVAIGGLAVNVVGCVLGYQRIVAGQPYRVLWLARLIQVPLTLQLAAWLWNGEGRTERHRLLAVVLAATLTPTLFFMPERLFLLLGLTVLGLFCHVRLPSPRRGEGSGVRGVDLPRSPNPSPPTPLPSGERGEMHPSPPTPLPSGERGEEKPAASPRPGWASLLALSAAGALLAGAVCREIALTEILTGLAGKIDPWDGWSVRSAWLGPLAWLLIGAVLLGAARRWVGLGTAGGLLLAGCFLACQLLTFLAMRTDCYQQLRRHSQDLRFIATFLKQHRAPTERPACLYWDWGDIELIWIDLRATSYYDRHQLQGAVFNEGTAREGKRRADLVERFNPRNPAPTEDDLLALCRDGRIDYAILGTDFPGLARASNGRVWIYDCQLLRAVGAAVSLEDAISWFARPRNATYG